MDERSTGRGRKPASSAHRQDPASRRRGGPIGKSGQKQAPKPKAGVQKNDHEVDGIAGIVRERGGDILYFVKWIRKPDDPMDWVSTEWVPRESVNKLAQYQVFESIETVLAGMPVIADPDPGTEPQGIRRPALRDRNPGVAPDPTYVIEQVIGICWNLEKKHHMYMVKWQGWSECRNTWEPLEPTIVPDLQEPFAEVAAHLASFWQDKSSSSSSSSSSGGSGGGSGSGSGSSISGPSQDAGTSKSDDDVVDEGSDSGSEGSGSDDGDVTDEDEESGAEINDGTGSGSGAAGSAAGTDDEDDGDGDTAGSEIQQEDDDVEDEAAEESGPSPKKISRPARKSTATKSKAKPKTSKSNWQPSTQKPKTSKAKEQPTTDAAVGAARHPVWTARRPRR